jgi:hypothetical protein
MVALIGELSTSSSWLKKNFLGALLHMLRNRSRMLFVRPLFRELTPSLWDRGVSENSLADSPFLAGLSLIELNFLRITLNLFLQLSLLLFLFVVLDASLLTT